MLFYVLNHSVHFVVVVVDLDPDGAILYKELDFTVRVRSDVFCIVVGRWLGMMFICFVCTEFVSRLLSPVIMIN